MVPGDAMTIKKTSIKLQVPTDQLELIQRAAEFQGQSPDQFVLGAAISKAQEILLDQTLFRLEKHAFQKVQDLLENTPEANENPGLLKLMAVKPIWGSSEVAK
jgi:uncharacterized protein (DUF1778 family)